MGCHVFAPDPDLYAEDAWLAKWGAAIRNDPCVQQACSAQCTGADAVFRSDQCASCLQRESCRTAHRCVARFAHQPVYLEARRQVERDRADHSALLAIVLLCVATVALAALAHRLTPVATRRNHPWRMTASSTMQ